MNQDDALFSSPWFVRLRAVFEILLISGLVTSFLASLIMAAIFGRDRLVILDTNANFLVTFLLLESAATFAILWILIKTHRETLPDLGLRKMQWKTNVLLGLLLAPLLLLINGVVSMVFHLFLPQYALERNPLTDTIQSPGQLALFILAAIIAGGIKEELQRAFILRRFQHHLGGSTIGVIVWSLVFGVGHYVQGAQGIFVATVYGFILGIFYLTRGSLIGPITAHAVYDTLALLLYWFSTDVQT